jgi:hypothetical protein
MHNPAVLGERPLTYVNMTGLSVGMVVATPSTLYTMCVSIFQLQIARRVAKVQTNDSSGCDLSRTRFELLASPLSSWADARTEGARAKRKPCGDTHPPSVL